MNVAKYENKPTLSFQLYLRLVVSISWSVEVDGADAGGLRGSIRANIVSEAFYIALIRLGKRRRSKSLEPASSTDSLKQGDKGLQVSGR